MWVQAVGVASETVFYGEADTFGFCPGLEMHAIDITTGKENFKFKTQGNVETILIAGQVIYFGGNDQNLYAVNLQDGIEKWRFKTNGTLSGTPIIDQDVIYFGSNDHFLRALDIKTGQELWKYKAAGRPCWSAINWGPKLHPITFSPSVNDGILYFIDSKGYLYALQLPVK